MMSALEYKDIDGDEASGSSQDEANCFREHHPFRNPRQFLSLVAAVLISAGLATVVLGYVIPRDYTFDPSLPAREMEEIELYYARLSVALDICVVAGMGLLALGGFVISVMVLYALLWEGEEKIYRRGDRPDLNLLDGGGDVQLKSYGSAADAP